MNRVAYEPLSISPPQNDCDLDSVEPGSCDEEDCLHDRRGRAKLSTLSRHKRNFDLKQLRLLLYAAAIILFLIFIAQLARNDRKFKYGIRTTAISSDKVTKLAQHNHNIHLHQIEGRELTSENPLAPRLIPRTTVPSSSKQQVNNSHPTSQSSSLRLPTYETYLASVLKARNSHRPTDADGGLIDDLRYISWQQNKAPWWTVNRRHDGKFITVTNYIRAMKSFNSNLSVTLTTQATIEFMHHTLELCRRWDGPLSVAVFGPGEEFKVAVTLIKFMRQCLPEPLSACIRDKVTWHLVYNFDHGPEPSSIKPPSLTMDERNYPLFIDHDRCPKLAAPEPMDTLRQFGVDLLKANQLYPVHHRKRHRLTYPINVLRNTARIGARTRFVLASDIELYPSLNLVLMFENYITKHRIQDEYRQVKKFIFTLPIFEVKSTVQAPKTKSELVAMFQSGDAIFFHKHVCDICQNFPNRSEWLTSDKLGLANYHHPEDELVVFEVTQRDKSRSSWEPIFIGTNEDPLYDDRLTWEGRRDKMAQMYELCLQDYYLLILGNAFLVHAPGIKMINQSEVNSRLQFMRENNYFYDSTIANLKQQYQNSSTMQMC